MYYQRSYGGTRHYYIFKTIFQVKADKAPYLTSKEKENLCAGVMQGTQATVLAQQIMEVPSLRRCILTVILQNIDQQCTKLCVKTKGTPSVLRLSRKDQNKLTSFTWMQILNELKDRAPDVLEILTTIAVVQVQWIDQFYSYMQIDSKALKPVFKRGGFF